MVVTVTLDGYIKRTPLSTFRAQTRGGKGRAGMATKDEDAVTELFVTSTHNPVLFFSTAGKVYRLKVWRLPEGGPPPAGGRWSTCCRRSTGRDHLRPCCRCPRTRTSGARSTSCSRPPRAPSAATRWTRSPTSRSNGKFAMRFDEDSEDRLIGVALLDRGRRRAARHPPGQGDPLRRRRRPRVPEPHLDRRARHDASSDDDEVISLSILHRVGATPGGARGLSRASPRGRPRRKASPSMAPSASPS